MAKTAVLDMAFPARLTSTVTWQPPTFLLSASVLHSLLLHLPLPFYVTLPSFLRMCARYCMAQWAISYQARKSLRENTLVEIIKNIFAGNF